MEFLISAVDLNKNDCELINNGFVNSIESKVTITIISSGDFSLFLNEDGKLNYDKIVDSIVGKSIKL